MFDRHNILERNIPGLNPHTSIVDMELLPLAVDGHLVTGTQETEYASCMFCTARCFKLHGHGAARSGVSSKAGHEASGSSPPRGGRNADLLSSDEMNAGGNRKHRQPFFVKTVKASTVSSRTNCELVCMITSNNSILRNIRV